MNDSDIVTCGEAHNLDSTGPASLGPTPCFPNKLLSGSKALNSKTGITDHFGTTSANLVSDWRRIHWKSEQIKDRRIMTRTTQVSMGWILLAIPDFLVNVWCCFLSPWDTNYSLFNSCPKPPLSLFTLINVEHYTLLLQCAHIQFHIFKRSCFLLESTQQSRIITETYSTCRSGKNGGSGHWHWH